MRDRWSGAAAMTFLQAFLKTLEEDLRRREVLLEMGNEISGLGESGLGALPTKIAPCDAENTLDSLSGDNLLIDKLIK